VILILSEPRDEHASYVADLLRRRGADFRVFDPADFPARAEIALSYSSAGCRHVLRAGGDELDLDRLQGVWYRRPKAPVPHAEVTDRRTRDYLAEECKTFVHDAWEALDARWLPAAPSVIRRAEPKAAQLRIAGELGFELPPTLITNSPSEFLEFYRRHNGAVVFKLVGPAFARDIGDDFARYTEVVAKRDVGYARAVRFCPVIFQAYVPKRLELRVTVVGQQVFAAEIHSQQTNHTCHDWRRYDHGKTPYRPHALPADVRRLCLRLVERLGLAYGAIDFVVTPDGRYVFLEINPNGQYLWVELATGLPISDAICDLLLAGPDQPTFTGEVS
jgi:glutathione synthase/RimK-type ligase-like ATP-grasp enzyme